MGFPQVFEVLFAFLVLFHGFVCSYGVFLGPFIGLFYCIKFLLVGQGCFVFEFFASLILEKLDIGICFYVFFLPVLFLWCFSSILKGAFRAFKGNLLRFWFSSVVALALLRDLPLGGCLGFACLVIFYSGPY